jgi:hypothetical protein
MSAFLPENITQKNLRKHLRRIWYFLHLCSIKKIKMKSLNSICSAKHAAIAICAMGKRSMVVAFNSERMDYNFDYGSRTR